jgi:hypothetical protein
LDFCLNIGELVFLHLLVLIDCVELLGQQLYHGHHFRLTSLMIATVRPTVAKASWLLKRDRRDPPVKKFSAVGVNFLSHVHLRVNI